MIPFEQTRLSESLLMEEKVGRLCGSGKSHTRKEMYSRGLAMINMSQNANVPYKLLLSLKGNQFVCTNAACHE